MDWTALEWLEAGGYAVAIITGLAGAGLFMAKKLKRFVPFRYPPVGEAGKNILSPEHTTVLQRERVALTAVVPEEATILVALSAAASPEGLRADIANGIGPGSGAAWSYRAMPAPLNWRPRDYEKEFGQVGARQNFVAGSGLAELNLMFDLVGEVVISVYERGTQVPTWTKTIQVKPSPGRLDGAPQSQRIEQISR